MAKKRDINRWKQGEDHWNKWAEGQIEARQKLENQGKWELDDNGNFPNAETKNWINSATVDFSNHIFKGDVDFRGFVFPHDAIFTGVEFKNNAEFSDATFSGEAWFREATFSGYAGFSDATFSGDAGFGDATFSGNAWFREATFSGNAWFDDATFSGNAEFSEATFYGNAWFSEATFSGNAWFREATFSGNAWFSEATFSGNAGFSKATFSGDVGFREATFSGDVGFDQCAFDGSTAFNFATFKANAYFNSAKSDGPFSLAGANFKHVPNFIQMSFRAISRLDDLKVIQARAFQAEGDKERAARYRALKKIAIDAHDHVREQEFFASEAKERRNNDDPKWSPAWIFSFCYELFSDFGQSIAAPFWWWVSSTVAFWFIYLAKRDFNACKGEAVQPFWDSLYLSMKSAFLVIGWGRSQKLNQAYVCLYGGNTTEVIIPTSVSFLQMGQTLWSAILIFLFLLALRNRFRIK